MKLFYSFLVVFCLSGCLGNVKKDVVSTNSNVPKEAFELTLTPYKSPLNNQTNAVLEIKDKISGKQWTITYSEFDAIYRSFNDWQTVSTQKPVITKVEDVNGKILVTFNYLDPKNNKSILSGVVTIDKNKIEVMFDDRQRYRYIIYGLSGYSIITTLILIVIL